MTNIKFDFSNAYVTLCPKCLSSNIRAIKTSPYIRFRCERCKYHFNINESAKTRFDKK